MLERAQPQPRSAASASRLPRTAGRKAAAALFFLAAVLPLAPVSGDWLVTTDGERIETSGPWEVRGRLIVYTTSEGTLASIRTSQVDLEASDRATAEAAAPTKEASETTAPEERTAVLVLTDRDVAKAPAVATVEQSDVEGAEGEGGESKATAPVAQAGAGSALVVGSYDASYDAAENQLVVTGQVRNEGRSLLTRLFLSAIAYDEDGSVIGRAEAVPDDEVLRPGATTTFRAVFPGLARYDRVAFNTASAGFVARGEGEEGSEEGQEQSTPPPPPGTP